LGNVRAVIVMMSFVVVVTVFCLFVTGNQGRTSDFASLLGGGAGTLTTTGIVSSTSSSSSETFDAAENARLLKEWRQNIRSSCQAAATASDVEKIGVANKQGFVSPAVRRQQPRGDRAVRRCQRLVADFGANIGDTSGHVIDAGLIGCERKDLEAATQPTHFDLETKRFVSVQKRNRLTQNLEHLMQTSDPVGGPEDYCYYGVEGNPVFTDRLQAIEDYVMAIRPRPVQHLHFFTESVGAGEDGPTKLYLDTVNTKENYWGSSIFRDHQDVRKSAAADSTKGVVAADVMGYTIGTLLRKTTTAFDPNATPEQKTGGHLVLKVDIEGGEYPLLHQAVNDGTLCEYVKMGNTADLFIEFHSQRVTGRHDYVGKTKEMKQKLTDCGVTFRNLQAWWA
jgi:hypothetical protein